MLAICDEYASEYSIIFNASKSKYIVVLPSGKRCLLPTLNNIAFYIGGCNSELVQFWPHLGHLFNSQLDDAEDIRSKRNKLISQINAVLCYFGKLDSVVKKKKKIICLGPIVVVCMVVYCGLLTIQ
jgi:hypothetical protein